MDLETIRQEARAVAEELITTAQMKPGQILVVGCSSSEIHNSKLGTDSSQEIGQAVFEALYACTKEHGLYLAAQCCEHLNRAVVLERAAAEKYGYEPVCAVPWLHGGGSFAMAAYYGLEDAVTVERVQKNIRSGLFRQMATVLLQAAISFCTGQFIIWLKMRSNITGLPVPSL